MTTVEFEIIPDPVEFSASINAVAAALETAEIPLAAAGSFIRDEIVEAFARKRDPSSGKTWAPWKESYAGYAESYPNTQLLRQSDGMYQALIADEAFMIEGDTLTYSPDIPPDQPKNRKKPSDPGGMRAEWHQEGAGKMVARPFIGPSATTDALILSTFAEWFDEAIDLFPTSTGKIGRRHAIKGGGPGGTQFVTRASVGKAPLPRR